MIDGNMGNEDGLSRMATWKHRVHAAIYPPREEKIPGFVWFLRAFVMLLIIASVFIVLVMACDPPPSVREICRRMEIWIAGIFAFEYLLRLWTADLEFSVERNERMASAPQPLRQLYACWMILKPRLRYMISGLAIVPDLFVLAAKRFAWHSGASTFSPDLAMEGDAIFCDAFHDYRGHQGKGKGFAGRVRIHAAAAWIPYPAHVFGRA